MKEGRRRLYVFFGTRKSVTTHRVFCCFCSSTLREHSNNWAACIVEMLPFVVIISVIHLITFMISFPMTPSPIEDLSTDVIQKTKTQNTNLNNRNNCSSSTTTCLVAQECYAWYRQPVLCNSYFFIPTSSNKVHCLEGKQGTSTRVVGVQSCGESFFFLCVCVSGYQNLVPKHKSVEYSSQPSDISPCM
jgi:hypothetical protein